MKVLVVLALAVFTGCQANIFYADEPKPQLEQLTDAFWSYVSKATQTAEETVMMIRSSQLGQEVNARLTQSADMASEYAVTLKKQMDPLAEELMTKITKEAEVLRERLGQDLMNARDKLEPYADNLQSQIQQRVEELRTAMAPYADSLDSETLKRKPGAQSLTPYTEDLKEKLDPYAQDLQAQLSSLYESFTKRN
uniref:Uncharacterized protein n=1 Tax=Cyprinus carpio TaxID=7962 RepID=A0A8C2I2J5_CYPCA